MKNMAFTNDASGMRLRSMTGVWCHKRGSIHWLLKLDVDVLAAHMRANNSLESYQNVQEYLRTHSPFFLKHVKVAR